MAEYRLKPGRLGQKVLDTYQKTEQAFAEKFLQEDPDSPSGYRLKTGKTGEQAVRAYAKIQQEAVGAYKKVENAFVDRFLEKTEEAHPEDPTHIQENCPEENEMKKSNFAAMILGTIGIVFFALGMCMALIEDWGLFRQGIVCGVVGLAVLLAALLIWRRMEGKPPIHLSVKTVETILVAVIGALFLGIGMCMTMVFGQMVSGIVIGLVGIAGLLMLIPLTKGFKD